MNHSVVSLIFRNYNRGRISFCESNIIYIIYILYIICNILYICTKQLVEAVVICVLTDSDQLLIVENTSRSVSITCVDIYSGPFSFDSNSVV